MTPQPGRPGPAPAGTIFLLPQDLDLRERGVLSQGKGGGEGGRGRGGFCFHPLSLRLPLPFTKNEHQRSKASMVLKRNPMIGPRRARSKAFSTRTFASRDQIP